MGKSIENLDIEEEITLSDDEMSSMLDKADLSEMSLESSAADELPDLDDDALSFESGADEKAHDDETIALSNDELGNILDDVDDSQILDLNQDVNSSSLDTDNENETIALSNDELGNILDDVDESQILDLNQKQTSSPGLVSVSGEELDTIADDDKDFDPIVKLKIEDSDNVRKSLEFEEEILADAREEDQSGRSDGIERLNDFTDENTEHTSGFENPPHGSRSQNITQLTKQKIRSQKLPQRRSHNVDEQDIENIDLYDLFVYLDRLLDYLPDEKVHEFAKSSYYDKYIALINRLGIKE